VFRHYEKRLRENFNKRIERTKEREQVMKQLGNLIERQKMDSVGKEIGEKENRGMSATKN
jgi:hypothetical protein